MKKGSVLVDVAIDQGGCIETSKPTTHSDPMYILHDVIHYCVTNMPGCVPRTSTYSLNEATISHIRFLAKNGLNESLKNDSHLRNGLNVMMGKCTQLDVARDLDLDFTDPLTLLN